MRKTLAAALTVFLACGGWFPVSALASFSDDYPALKKFHFSEGSSRIYFGFGAVPLSIVKNKAGYGFSIFQVHWVRENLDFELFNASFTNTVSDTPTDNSKSFMFRASPKFRVFRSLSVGPLGGWEFVSFPEVGARIGNGTFFTPSEPFSTRGFFYGVAASQNFSLGEGGSQLKATQLIYRQGYSTVESSQKGWNYFYDDMRLNTDQGPVAPGWVFLLEFAFLY